MNPYSFSSLVAAICTIIIGLFVLARQKKSPLHRIFFWYSAAISAWAFLIALSMASNVETIALLCGRASHAFVPLIPVCFLHFTLILLGRNKQQRFLLRTGYVTAGLLGIFSLTTSQVIAAVSPRLGYSYFIDPGFLYVPLIVFFLIFSGLGLLFLLEAAVRASGSEMKRKQCNYLFWSSLIGYVAGASNFLPTYGITWFPYPYGSYGITLYIFVVAYITFKYGFFDLEDLAQAAHRDKLTAIGVLAASINHEVRNPLYVIQGLAESCLERQKEGIFKNDKQVIEAANDALRRSKEQADRAMDIIKRLSLFAKAGIESELKFEPVRVADVLEDILPLIRYELAANSIGLTREIPKDLPDVHADRRYLEEILFNLLVNAIQAIKTNSPSEDLKVNWASPGNLQSEKSGGQGKGMGKPGEIRVTAGIAAGIQRHRNDVIATLPLSCDSKTQGKQSPVEQEKVIITIQDTGPGIPEEKIRDVFRPFYTTKEEGTGLGLYITQQLVEKIRGRIKVESQSGVGTTFTVILPVT